MGHNIDALIAEMPIDKEKAAHYGLAVAFEQNYAILLLDRDHLWAWYQITGLDDTSASFEDLYAGSLVHFFAKELGLSTYAIIHTDYFAGMGEQRAVLFNSGEAVANGSINQVLKLLGVIIKDKPDEFEQINLDQYRATEYYYWSGDSNHSKFVPGMLPGKIPR